MTPFDLSIQEYADPDVLLDPKKIRRLQRIANATSDFPLSMVYSPDARLCEKRFYFSLALVDATSIDSCISLTSRLSDAF